MAISTTGKQFRFTLLRVSEVLTKKNVHDLAFLCEAISPDRREELEDALDLFGTLQGHHLLSENNVDTLIEWLEELRLVEASKLLRDYRNQHPKPVVTSQAMCHIHKDVPLKYVCVSCELAEKREMVRPVPYRERRNRNNGGVLGEISVGTPVGAVSIGVGPRQLVKIFDRRYPTGNVWLVCVDPEDPNKEYWRHSMKVDHLRSPVVCSPVDMCYEGRNHVLMAVGKIVYIVHPHRMDGQYDFVERIEPMVIGEVPKGSYITNITVNLTFAGGGTHFMVALFRSSVIRQYNLSGKLVRSIEIMGHVFSSGISGLACSETNLAVLSCRSDDVMLLSVTEEMWRQHGYLGPLSAGFTPTVIIWTRHQWLMLCTTRGRKRRWKVVLHDENGKFVKEVLKGTSTNEFDLPSSLTRFRRVGYAISASKILVFEF